MKNQKGAVLVISLIMLIVMTLIGMTAMRTSILEEKMAGNMRDQISAFEAAESALRDGEDLLAGLADVSSFGVATGRLGPGTNPDYFDINTWSNSIAYSGTLPDVATQPQYIIQYVGALGGGEEIHDHDEPNHVHNGRTCSLNRTNTTTSTETTEAVDTFTITARGTGRTNKSSSIIQTYYRSGEGRTSWIELSR